MASSDRADTLLPVDVTFQHVWLFVRGQESVRIQRTALQDGTYDLLIEGPKDAEERRHYPDLLACVTAQSDLERELLVKRFFLEALTERRRGLDREAAAATYADRRRALRVSKST